jgi:hypothetical protein
LEVTVGGEVVGIFLNSPYMAALKVGVVHNIPYLFVGVGSSPFHGKPYIFLSLLHSCNGMQFTIFNNVKTLFTRNCPGCADELRRFEEAKERVIAAIQNASTTTDAPPTKGIRKGALMEWLE